MTQDQDTVEIIQADRDAAASVHISSLHGEAIREGAMDANHVVQAFAKHRLSHSSTPSEVERLLSAKPDLGAASPEPDLRSMVFGYYRAHFDRLEASRLTEAYCAALSEQGKA